MTNKPTQAASDQDQFLSAAGKYVTFLLITPGIKPADEVATGVAKLGLGVRWTTVAVNGQSKPMTLAAVVADSLDVIAKLIAAVTGLAGAGATVEELRVVKGEYTSDVAEKCPHNGWP